MCLEPPFGDVHPEIKAAVEATAKHLEELGHRIEPRDTIRVEVEDFLPLWQLQLACVPAINDEPLQPVTRWLREAGRKLDISEVRSKQRQLSQLVATMLGDADLLLTPTVPVLPGKVGAFAQLPPAQAFAQVAAYGSFTAGCNITGQPAASIPAGVSDDGNLPYGVQLAGHVDHDAEVLAVCKQLEEAMPWRTRRPSDYLPSS